MENDPLYQQGLKHFGLGQWSEAVACFTQLQINHPEDARVRQFLETARLRAAAGTGLERSAQAQTRSGWVTIGSRLIVLLIIIGIGVAIYLAYQAWIVPAQVETARLAKFDRLRQTAEVQIASGQYPEAAQTYQSILTEAPDDQAASAGLQRAQQLDRIAQLYGQATQSLNIGDQAGAARWLEEISALDPNYRDTTSLLAQIKLTEDLTNQYAEAERLRQAGQLLDALRAYETIRATNRSFKPDEIDATLYTIYMQLADKQLKQATTVSAVEAVISLYQQALTVRPLDAPADTARRLALTFVDTASAYQAKQWDAVIQKASLVYEQAPDYFGGKVQQWLYEAYVTTGRVFLSKGDPFSARDRFREARRVAVTDAQKTEAQKLYTEADTLTTPTPTPTPVPTLRSTPTPISAGHVAPAWTLRPTGTPNPNPFIAINTTYLPNMITGEGCSWAGVAGRFFDRRGDPLISETLGMRVMGPLDTGVAAGSYQLLGESGWMVQFDARSKVIEGFIQVFYKDKPVSDLIPFKTSSSCMQNMIIIDVQQVKPLTDGTYLYTPKTPTKK
ncbi:MAG: tetratricopeptide repeat protein [Thermoflexales bacterium]|nr:tetratricopeptide repeat protein [Thermoflexales bacterium]